MCKSCFEATPKKSIAGVGLCLACYHSLCRPAVEHDTVPAVSRAAAGVLKRWSALVGGQYKQLDDGSARVPRVLVPHLDMLIGGRRGSDDPLPESKRRPGAEHGYEDSDAGSPPSSSTTVDTWGVSNMPVEILHKILVLITPDAMPEIATAPNSIRNAVFNQDFVTYYNTYGESYFETKSTPEGDVESLVPPGVTQWEMAITYAFGSYRLLFVQLAWPLLNHDAKESFLSYCDDWQFVWLYKRDFADRHGLTSDDLARRVKSYLVRISDTGQPYVGIDDGYDETDTSQSMENAFLAQYVMDKEKKTLDIAQQSKNLFFYNSQMPGITAADLTTGLVGYDAVGSTALIQVSDFPNQVNLPTLRLLANYSEMWRVVSAGQRDDFAYFFRNDIISSRPIIEFSRASWFNQMITRMQMVRGWLDHVDGYSPIFVVNMCSMSLHAVEKIVNSPIFTQFNELRSLSVIARPDIAVWMLMNGHFTDGLEDGDHFFYIAEKSAFGRFLVSQLPFKVSMQKYEGNEDIRDIYLEYLEGGYLDNDEYDKITDLEARNPIYMDYTGIQPHADNYYTLLMLFKYPSLMAIFMYDDERRKSITVRSVDLLELFEIAYDNPDKRQAASYSLLLFIQVYPTVSTDILKALITKYYADFDIVYACSSRLAKSEQTDDDDEWLAKTFMDRLREPIVSVEKFFNLQNFMRAFLLPQTAFPWRLVDWKAVARLQRDDRYYCFEILYDSPTFDPSVNNNILCRTAFARGQLAFVQLWLRDSRVVQQFESRELAVMRAAVTPLL